MDIDLDELERLAKAATPGPWVTEDLYSVSHYDEASEWHGIVVQADICGKIVPSEKDAAYIVAACNAVPELISMYRKAKDEANDADTAYQMVDRDNVDLTRHILELRAKVAELERQREFFLKALNDNRLCPNGGCGGLNLDEWDCTSYDNRECWIQAAKEAGE